MKTCSFLDPVTSKFLLIVNIKCELPWCIWKTKPLMPCPGCFSFSAADFFLRYWICTYTGRYKPRLCCSREPIGNQFCKSPPLKLLQTWRRVLSPDVIKLSGAYARRRMFSSAGRNGLAKISILTRIKCRNPSSFIEDIQTILPLFQGNIRCLLPVVVAERLYI